MPGLSTAPAPPDEPARGLNRGGPASDRTSVSEDRRQHTRLDLARPVKVYLPQARQYVAGATSNVSVGGAMLDLRSNRPLGIGDYVDVGVQWHSAAVLRAEQLVQSRIVRVQTRTDGSQRLAVAFIARQALAVAA